DAPRLHAPAWAGGVRHTRTAANDNKCIPAQLLYKDPRISSCTPNFLFPLLFPSMWQISDIILRNNH
ncbi:hypothetical protein ABN235_18970, partial [Morganella morganii]|uniref:hypothetical protein n=1 Tax=Morganella morganii TaxID=582 RepID=UPI0032DB8B55